VRRTRSLRPSAELALSCAHTRGPSDERCPLNGQVAFDRPCAGWYRACAAGKVPTLRVRSGGRHWRSRWPTAGRSDNREWQRTMHASFVTLRVRQHFTGRHCGTPADDEPKTTGRGCELPFIAQRGSLRGRMSGTCVAPGSRSQDIALALGYSETIGFTHAFLRWSGTAPSEWPAKLWILTTATSREA
jgi:AraC-like DNA-binding protein